MTCRHWKELESDTREFEYCKGIQRTCACSGTITQCNFPEFFNVPPHRLEQVRQMRRAQDTAAEVAPFVEAR